MDFEEIIEDVGSFGLYQKLLVTLFLIPAFTVIPWFSMNPIFSADTPDHWCKVPEVSSSNLSLDVQKMLIRPLQDPYCSMYDVNYSQILLSGNLTMNTSDWPIRECTNGWQYDNKDYVATAVTKWNLVCENSYYASLTLSLIFIGTIIGTPLYGFMSDRLGRKPTFLFLASLVAITEISSVLSPNFTLFLLLRAINGSPMNVIYGTGYMIPLELVSPEIRAKMNGIVITSWTLGLCLLPLVAYLTAHWIYLSIVVSSAATSLLLYSLFIPESPRWLISQHRYKEAAAILEKIGNINGKKTHDRKLITQKIQKLGEKIKNEDGKGKASPTELLTNRTLRRIFLLYTMCSISTAIPYFGVQFNIKNLAGNRFLNFFLMSLVEAPSHFATWWLLDRIGRRWCFFCGFLISASACILATVFPLENGMIAIIASLCVKIGASSTYMTVYQIGPEMLPTSLRGVGIALSSTIGLGSALLAPYIVYMDMFGNFIPYLCFAILSTVAAVCALFLPETLNQKLPQTITDTENLVKNSNIFCHIRNPKTLSEKTVILSSTKDVISDRGHALSFTPDSRFPVVLQKISSLNGDEK